MKRLMIVLCITFIVISGLLPAISLSTADDGAITGNKDASGMAEWTFMVYMASDNNLEGAGIEDLNEMETVGSSKELNFIVQVDRAEGYDTSNDDWKGAKRYRMEKDEDTAIVNSPELADMGEINMGDPSTLADFIIWAYDNYPAKHYFLDLWDHGGAFWGICWDDSEGSGDPISMTELKEALETSRKHMGRGFDMIGFDACLMAQLAVLYQIKDFADYSVASGFVEPGDGWPYETIFAGMAKDPGMSPEELGSEIVNDYLDSYTDKASDPDDSYSVTMALFDLDKIVELTQELNRYSMLLATKNIRHNLQVKGARSVTECYAYPPNPGPFKISTYTLFDIIDLIDKIDVQVVFDSEVNGAGRKVQDMAREMMIDTRSDPYHRNANGLSLYFPNGIDAVYDPLFSELDFAEESYWDEYLKLFPDLLTNAENTPPSITIDLKQGESIKTNNDSYLVTGTVFDLQEDPAVHVRIDEGEWELATVLEGGDRMAWHFPWDLTDLGDTNHTIDVKASDSSGEESGVISREIQLEKGGENYVSESSSNWWGVIVLVAVVTTLVGATVYLMKNRK
ncbi:MAG: clostripain-related cysteine peptidase [Candidatus Thermoplasmatota archaeon]|nr:clostripain-related cysteine peptidase [Candidatus Thermoplasmatota archaeon]